MGGSIRTFLLVIAILAVGYAGAISYGIFFGGPPLTIRDDNSGVVVDLRLRGEHHASPDRVQIRDSESDAVIWEIAPAGLSMRIGTFRLAPGPNPVGVGLADPVGVVAPQRGDSFDLFAGREYIFSVWGPNEYGYKRKATARFTL